MAVTLVGTPTTGSGTVASGGNLTVTKVTGVQQGDLMIVVAGMNGPAGGATWAKPTGWTQELNFQGNLMPMPLFYKLAGASEGTSYNFVPTASGSVDGGWGMVALRGVDQATPVLGHSAEFDQGGNSTSMTANSVSWAGAANAISVIFMTWQTSAATVTWPSGWDSTTNGFSANDGFEWCVVGSNLTTQIAVTSLPSKTNPPTLSVGEFGECGQLAVKVASPTAVAVRAVAKALAR
jgi:hypothetical protein